MATTANGNIDFIIPAIDIIEGRAVRLTHGDYNAKTVYHPDPLWLAKSFEDAGIRRLHLVDLDGAKAGTIRNWKLLEKITAATSLKVDFGGGVKTREEVAAILNAGAYMVTIGSVAVRSPQMLHDWVQQFGTDKFFIGADVLDQKLRISGWLQDAGISIHQFLKDMIGIGLRNFFCTDISKDGALTGTSLTLYENILGTFPGINLTASGGVACMQDIAAAKAIGCKGIIVGKALYEGRISLTDIQQFNEQNFSNAV